MDKFAQTFVYNLKVQIQPSINKIDCSARICHPPNSCFYLHKDFHISQITTNGKPLSFHQVPEDFLPYTVGCAVIIDDGYQNDILIEYSGVLDQVISAVNMIQNDLVELALYSAWFPLFNSQQLFDFELEIDLPASYIPTSNGVCIDQQHMSDRSISKWKSFKPCFDIVLIASPHFQKIAEEQSGTQIEIFFRKTPREYIATKKALLLKALNWLTSIFGELKIKGILRYVHSPRTGWGYARDPLFVVSEEQTLAQLGQEFGPERDFHYSAHELSHFWWAIADAATPDDWINEGLAEYSAFRISEMLSGKDFSENLVLNYREHAAQSRTHTPIAETTNSSDDREVNRYEKTTLIFIEAGRRYGREKLNQVFKTLHTQFTDARNATTHHFLEEVRNQLGIEAENFFHRALYQREWIDPQTL